MNVTELWENACQLMKEEVSEVAYRTWIESPLKPIDLQDNTVLLEVVADFMKPMITSRYQALMNNALSRVAGHEMTAELLTQQEALERKMQASAPQQDTGLALNPRYTFDTFVVGNNNRFAHAVSLAVAEAPGKAYNPLFIYGGVGLGKTHLMHAIGHYVQQQYPDMKLLYITSESFTNELIVSLQNNKNQEFRDRFRNVDILMVDDIQFIAGRNSTQEEFFHTFNALHSAGKQIIMTSDKPPKEIAKLEERLCSRFEGGLIADIQRPDLDTRIAILRKKAESEHISMSDDVLNLIADKVDSNIRELEGSLTKVVAYASLNGKPVDAKLAEEALRDAFNKKDARRITVENVQETVANYYGITVEDIKSARRNREVTVPRQIAMFLTRDIISMSLPRIGESFGGRDHTTVMHSCDKVTEEMKLNPSLASVVDDIRKQLRDGK